VLRERGGYSPLGVGMAPPSRARSSMKNVRIVRNVTDRQQGPHRGSLTGQSWASNPQRHRSWVEKNATIAEATVI